MGAQGSVTITGHFDISSARKSAQELQNILNKLNLNQNLSKSVNSVFGKLETEFTNFQGLLSKEMKSPKDLKGIESSYNNIINLVNNLQAQIQNIQGIDINKLIPADFTGKLKEIINGYNELTQAKAKAEKEKTSKQNELDVEINKITKSINDRKTALENLNKAQEKFNQSSKNLANLQDEKQNYINQKKRNEEIKKGLEDEKRLREKIQQIYREKDATEKARLTKDFFSDLKKTSLGDKLSLAETPSQASANTQKLNQLNKIINQKVTDLLNTNKELDAKIKETQDKIAIASKEKSSATGKLVTAKNKVEDTSAIDIAALERTLANIQAQKANLTASLDPTALQKFRAELAAFAGVDISKIPTDLSKIGDYINTLQTNKVTELREQLQGLGITANGLKTPFSGFENSLRQARNELTQMEMVSRDLDRMKYSVANFFSVFTGARMLKNTLHQASQAIKELDAAMAETAVVTNFSVSDMWDQLDLYTGTANKLGATTLGAYETMTLFYQQGLNTEQAFTVGTETMKMARIAGMEYSEATEKMTAALRGFNMEINEISAQRVNDVYSELAKITAADTDQIATAMTKTASIADSANMSFENTAAFLTQIIETTQEAPETAGTALKTIIARFSEVKELYSKGQLTGTDEEGEVININKIDKALKSVGMSLNKFILGEQGLDEVFMELASKWDTLDLATQRYIATQAAGSRQQSRFIAMMNDYERTVELATAARDSEGSSEEQFGKTLDSMEAKTNKMKNAWQEFTLSIMDSDTLKDGVDALTTILQLINNITDALGGKSSGALKIGTALGLGVLGKKTLSGLMQLGHAQSLVTTKLFDPTKESVAGKTMSELMADRNSAFKRGFLGSRGINRRQAITAYALYNSTAPISVDFQNYQREISGFEKNFDKNYAKYVKRQKNRQQEPLSQEAIREKAIADIQRKNKVDPQLLKAAQQQEKLIKGAARWGIALTAAGTAVQGIASSMEESGKYSKELTESISGIATAAQLAGTSFILISQILPLLNASHLASPFMIVAGVVAGLVAIYKIWDATTETTAEKTERLAEEAANAQAAAEAASKAYDELLGGKSAYNDRIEALQKLTKGTIEYQMALAEANAETAAFSEKYGVSLNIGENGLLSYDEFSYKQIQKNLEQESISAANRSIFSNAANKEWKTLTEYVNIPGVVEYIDRKYSTVGGAFDKYYHLKGTAGIYSSAEAVGIALEQSFSNGEADMIKQHPEAYAIWQSQNASEAAAIQSIMSSSKLQTTGVDVLDNLLLSQVSQDIAKEKNLADLKDQLKEDLNENNIDEEAAKIFNNTFLESDEYQKATLDQKKAMVAEQTAINTLQEETTAAYDKLFESYDSLDDDQKQVLKEYDQKTSEEIKDYIKNFAQGNSESQKVGEVLKQQYFSQYGSAMSTFQSIFNDSNFDKNQSRKLIGLWDNAFNLSQLETLKKIGTELSTGFGNDIAAGGLATIANLMMDSNFGKEFEDSISNINFNNVFTSLEQLKTESTKVGEDTKKALLTVREGLIKEMGPSGLFGALVNSEEYAEIESQVSDFIKNTGDLTASNILEIADNVDILNSYLETGEATSGTLAEILKGIANDDYSLDNLTDSLIEALNIATEMDSALAKAFDYIDNFSAARSEKDFGGFAQERVGSIVDALGAGRYNDSAARQSVKLLFGDTGLSQYQNFIDNLDSNMTVGQKRNLLETSMPGVSSALTSIQEKGNFSGWFDYWNNQPGKQNGSILAELGIQKNKDGSYDFSDFLSRYDSMESATQGLSNGLGVDYDIANVALQEAKAQNYGGKGNDAWVNLQQQDYINSLNTLFKSGEPVTQAQIDALGRASDLTQEQRDAALNKFQNESKYSSWINKGGEGGQATIGGPRMADNWLSSDFKTWDSEGKRLIGAQARQKALEQYYGGEENFVQYMEDQGIKAWQTEKVIRSGGFKGDIHETAVDMDALTKEFESMGMTPEQAVDSASEYVKKLGEGAKLSKDIQMASGETVPLIQEAGESAADFAKRCKEVADEQERQLETNIMSEGVAKGIKQAFADFGTEGIQFNWGNLDEGINKIEEIQKAKVDIKVKADHSQLTAAKDEFDSIDNKEITITVKYNEIGRPTYPMYGKEGSLANRIPGFAKGKKPTIKTSNGHKPSRDFEGISQIAEKGPELVVGSHGTYLAGINGPGFTYVHKDDTIYTARETRQILGSIKNQPIPGFSIGKSDKARILKPPSPFKGKSYDDGFSLSGSSGGSGKKDKENKENTWDPDYDRFYNLLDDIEKQLREQTKLERNLEIIKRNQEKSSNLNEARDLFKQQITNYNEQAEQQRRSYSLNAQLLKGKQWEIQKFMADNASYQKFATYNELTDTIDISWDTIMSRANWDAEYGQQVDDYISKVEELRDQLWDAEDAMMDAEDAIRDLEDELRDYLDELKQNYLDMEQALYDALVSIKQQEITDLQEITDVQFNSNAQILTSIQEVIAEQRKLRDIAEAREDLEEKQRRLALLRRDGSGANALEIKKLEEELEDQQENFVDSLVDKSLEDLSKQNDKAQQQRQEQITLLQNLLDFNTEYGVFWPQISEMLESAFSEDGYLDQASALVEVMKKADNFKGMSELGQDKWWNDLQKTVVNAILGLDEAKREEANMASDLELEQAIALLAKEGIDAYDVLEYGATQADDFDDGYGSDLERQAAIQSQIVKANDDIKKYTEIRDGFKKEQASAKSEADKALATYEKNKSDANAKDYMNKREKYNMKSQKVDAAQSVIDKMESYKAILTAKLAKFKSGGLANFTGPAWLDGTKSRPEIVLSASDSKNFLQLKDILREMDLDNLNNRAATYFDIHIDVDEISSDYDVDKLANRVKELVVSSAQYRNNVVINRKR